MSGGRAGMCEYSILLTDLNTTWFNSSSPQLTRPDVGEEGAGDEWADVRYSIQPDRLGDNPVSSAVSWPWPREIHISW